MVAPPISFGPCALRAVSPPLPEGSVLVEYGDTRVLCTASIEEGVPPFLRGKAHGWVTAEYGMLPRATHTRTQREAARGKQTGRTQEIQRLIGRSLRAAVNLEALGERTVLIDCDVLQADGGTRTASITGSYLALAEACDSLLRRGLIAGSPLHGQIAAVSVGIVRGEPLLDLDYAEDSEAETDMNVVMNNGGGFVEVQGTAEGHALRRHELDALLNAGRHGHRAAVRLAGSSAGCLTASARDRCESCTASANAGKQRELSALLEPCGLRLRLASEFHLASAPETGASLHDNAMLKARYAARATGLATLADDSGLEVDALHGRPGVLSARYARPSTSDQDNNARLLSRAGGSNRSRGAAIGACWCCCAPPRTPSRCALKARGRVRLPPNWPAREALATIHYSSRKATIRPWRSCRPRSNSN